jgi:hypothetical protein
VGAATITRENAMNSTSGPAAIDSRPPMDCAADVEYKEIYMAPNSVT